MLLKKAVNDVSVLIDKQYVKKKQVFDTFLKYGGYPAISDVDIADEDKYEWLKNYVKTYLERDIRDLAEFNSLEPFAKTQKLLAINSAQLINYSQIAVEAGVTLKTVQRFLEYLSISYQTIVLQSWSRNTKKRMVKSPKVHFMDVGVLRTLLNKKGELTGSEFESAVISEIYKQVKSINIDVSFYHLITTDGREVDLLVELEEGYIAIEIKKTEKIRSVDARHLRNLVGILDKPVLKSFVLSNDLSISVLVDEITGISALQFLT